MANGMPFLDSCCRCCTLKTGTIVTGTLSFLVSLVTLILILVTNVKLKTIVIDTLPSDIVKIIIAINLVMTMLISVLLLIGAWKRNKFLMLPWVILAIMLIIGILISIIWTSIVLFINGESLSGGLMLFFGILSVILYTYLWLVVFSYYQLLQQEGNRGPYSKNPYVR